MNKSDSFMDVLGKTAQQVEEDIDEFVEQFLAAQRNNKNADDLEGTSDVPLSTSEQDARNAAAECLDVLTNIGDGVRNAFNLANLKDFPKGRIIEEAEDSLRRIVQTPLIDHSETGKTKSLDTAAASGIIIRCRKYWKAHTDHPLDLGNGSASKPYGEFLEFVSARFELDPTVLSNRELEIQKREQAFKELTK
ncbi:MAG: hypothetical protein QNI91_14015 [Arenicellales bacterium]|nr:hypothetical protein [Arenicellales bacterium]